MLYIDPPYSLEKMIFLTMILIDEDDGYKHSKWLSFMNRRLRLAYNLLNDTGLLQLVLMKWNLHNLSYYVMKFSEKIILCLTIIPKLDMLTSLNEK